MDRKKDTVSGLSGVVGENDNLNQDSPSPQSPFLPLLPRPKLILLPHLLLLLSHIVFLLKALKAIIQEKLKKYTIEN